MMARPAVDISGVEFRRKGRVILTDVDLTVAQGEHWVALRPQRYW